jgi:hypothetical protein
MDAWPGSKGGGRPHNLTALKLVERDGTTRIVPEVGEWKRCQNGKGVRLILKEWKRFQVDFAGPFLGPPCGEKRAILNFHRAVA